MKENLKSCKGIAIGLANSYYRFCGRCIMGLFRLVKSKKQMIKNKHIFSGLGIVLILYAATWLFNHVNPWFGIGLVIILLISLNQLFKNKKSNEKSI